MTRVKMRSAALVLAAAITAVAAESRVTSDHPLKAAPSFLALSQGA